MILKKANKAEEPACDSFIGSLISSQAHHSSSYFLFDQKRHTQGSWSLPRDWIFIHFSGRTEDSG